MDRRPDSNHNGPSNGKSYTNGNGKGVYPTPEVRRTVALRPYAQRRSSLLPLLGLCLLVGLGTVLLFQAFHSTSQTEAQSADDAFRLGVNRAMSAAELTQTARSPREWQQVATWWQEAIEFMEAVPGANQNYAIARDRVGEYRKNLQYADQKAKTASGQDSAANLWGLGSRRAEVLKVQGTPTETDRYDATCKEVLRYGKSNVELNNGIVVSYEDFDRKLKVVAPDAPAPVVQRSTWGLDSAKDLVFQVQGTPTRIVDYNHSDRETLYYGTSTVDLLKQRVIGYDNSERNLKVRVDPILTDAQGGNLWTLDSSREEIFRVQGTPTAVLLEQSACSETLYYGNSTIVLKNGFIAGYDNLDNNLRVKAR